MSKSSRLRVEDVRAAFRLVGDCCDLGRDPAAWNAVLVRGLSELVGSFMTNTFTINNFLAGGPADSHLLADDWPDPASYKWWLEYHYQEGFKIQPSVLAFHAVFDGTTTRRREELIPTREWVKSEERTGLRMACQQDEFLYTGTPLAHPAGRYYGMTLNRTTGERAFSSRERNLVSLLHEEIGDLLGTRLLLKPNELLATLSPRLREVLAAILEGDGEKQVAARLVLSPHTVHEYVGMLYERFGVCSRVALAGAYLRMSGPPTNGG